MAEPASSATGGFLVGKLAYALGGFVGGLTTSMFWTPQRLRDHGKLAAGGIMVAAPTLAAAFTGVSVARRFGLNEQDLDVGLALGWVIGLLTIFCIAVLANFFRERESSDIISVARDVRTGVDKIRKGTEMAKKPAKKPARKAGGRKDILTKASSSQPMNQR
jgi:hypothetical protein